MTAVFESAEWRLWRHHNRGGLCSPLHYRKHSLDACFTFDKEMVCVKEWRVVLVDGGLG